MEKLENVRINDIKNVKVDNVNDERVIIVTYEDGTFVNVAYDEEAAILLKKVVEAKETVRKAQEKAKENREEIVAIPGTEKTITENTGISKNDFENAPAAEPKKRSNTWKYVLAGVGIGAVMAFGLNSCHAKEQTAADTAIETIEENEVEIPEDMTNVTLSYEDVIEGIKTMDASVEKALLSNGKNIKIDDESIAALYTWLNLENIEPEAIAKMQSENIIPSGATGLATESFKSMDTIRDENTEYMYGLADYYIHLSDYVVDPDSKDFVVTIDNMIEEIRELAAKSEAGTLTEADKTRAAEIYRAIDRYERSQGVSELGSHHSYNEGVTKMEDMININAMLQGLGRARLITQQDINAITGTHIDPATGKEILNTPINDWANIMGEYNRICNGIDSYNETKTK